MNLPKTATLKRLDVWYDYDHEHYKLRDRKTGKELWIDAHEIMAKVKQYLIRNNRSESDLLDEEVFPIMEEIFFKEWENAN